MSKKTESKKGRATDFDKVLGEKLREYRTAAHMAQAELAERCGITFQQIQKYESGANRVSASRLFDFSEILGVPVIDFYPQGEKHTGIVESQRREIDDLKSLIKGVSRQLAEAAK